MELNADFGERVAVHAARLDWVPSPMPGVDRRMLDRIGDEMARATTIVRYAPGSSFSSHVHGGGEEFLVLEGVFQDEHGDFPVGTYVRNPPTSEHTPASAEGCVIFVKLWQFDPDDRVQLRIDTTDGEYVAASDRAGVELLELHRDRHELVAMERWSSGERVELDATGGLEALVIEGSFAEGDEELTVHSWLRLPEGSRSTAVVGPEGALVWTKRGHLTSLPPTTPMQPMGDEG